MGHSPRPRPLRLASKLLQIRTSLDLTQAQMIIRLNYQQSSLYPNNLSEFEQGKARTTIAAASPLCSHVGSSFGYSS